MKSLIAMAVAAFVGRVAAQQKMQTCDPGSSWQIYEDDQCTRPGKWQGSGILPVGREWTQGCYNPTNRMFRQQAQGYNQDVEDLKQTANMINDQNWPAIKESFEQKGMDLSALGTDLSDGQATINAYVRALENGDVDMLQKVMQKSLQTSLNIQCSGEGIQVQIFKENGQCGRDPNGGRFGPAQSKMLRWGECIRIKDIKEEKFYRFNSPMMRTDMSSLATNVMKATFASAALALASLMY